MVLPRLVRALLAGIGTATEVAVPGPHVHGYRLGDPATWSLPDVDVTSNSRSSTAGRPAGLSDGSPATAPPATGGDPAGNPPCAPAGSPPFDTSTLLIAAANQLDQLWHCIHQSMPLHANYIDELVPELRDRAARFAAHGD